MYDRRLFIEIDVPRQLWPRARHNRLPPCPSTGDSTQRYLAQDVVMVAEEAVSNAVEHAYPDRPGTLTMFAACSLAVNAVRIIVSDRGRWRWTLSPILSWCCSE
ncbi:ATP-binding protein [Kibdelosporangium aridum]|uniref:ATP-binding protein n=1 Tax=Kibdelosporangium aridum TaxID=2030 RepID=UPI000A014A75|nr:ATP-binding protein [Kibdelosporangium aridum]